MSDNIGILDRMDDTEATQLMLEALFDIRAKVSDIHSLFIEEEDDDGEAQEEEDA